MYAIVVGDDRIAEEIAARMARAGAEVGIVASHNADDLAMSLPEALVIRGAGGDARALEAAGGRIADVVVAACADDAANIAACVEAKRLFGVERVVALSRCPDNAPAFDALDVSVVCATDLIVTALLSRVGVGSEMRV